METVHLKSKKIKNFVFGVIAGSTRNLLKKTLMIFGGLRVKPAMTQRNTLGKKTNVP